MLAFVPVTLDLYRTVRRHLHFTLQNLVAFADRTGRCFPSVRTLAAATGQPRRGPSRDWGCDGGRVFPHSFSDRGWIRGLGFEAGGNRGGRRGIVRGRGGD